MKKLGTYEATRTAVSDLCRRFGRPRVLDIGCGDGTLLAALAPSIERGYGIDISWEAVAAASERSAGTANLGFRVASVERLVEMALGPFDLILFVGSLEHMTDPEAALDAARRHLRPAGRVIVVAISPDAPHAVISRWMLTRSENPVIAHLGVAGLRRLAPRTGLRIDEVRPLRRGAASLRRPSRRSERLTGSLLDLYDRIGGPTCLVSLAADASRRIPRPDTRLDSVDSRSRRG